MIAMTSDEPKWALTSSSRRGALKRLTKRVSRLFLCCLLVTTSLIVCLSMLHMRSRHRTWTVEKIVHNQDATKVQNNEYTLYPFPESPLNTSPPAPGRGSRHPNPWLAAVICSANDVHRRMLIRTTWMRLFGHLPFDARFVVSNPGPDWNETIRFENQTFGDLIVLDHIHEDDITANTVKTLEFYKWLLQSGRKYEFVTKLDTDLWLNAPAFWDRYLVPRLSNKTGQLTASVQQTIIGQLYFSDSGWNTFAHGAIYTVTWDVLELLVSLQDRFKVFTGEDAAVGILVHKARKLINFVNFRGDEKFDYDDADSRSDDSAWARSNTHPNATTHALYGNNVVAVHNLKTQSLWMKVAACFDQDGIKPMPPMQKPEKAASFMMRWKDFWDSTGLWRAHISTFDKIPKGFFTYTKGRWICDGIWDLGENRMGYS